MESFLVAVNAVVPFLCYITFGYVMKIKGVVKEDFLQQLNKMVFKVFYPFMTFYNIYKADAKQFQIAVQRHQLHNKQQQRRQEYAKNALPQR